MKLQGGKHQGDDQSTYCAYDFHSICLQEATKGMLKSPCGCVCHTGGKERKYDMRRKGRSG